MAPNTVPRQRSRSAALGRDLVGDWEHLVRISKPEDLDAVLQATGYRPFRTGLPAEPASPTTANGSLGANTATADARLAELVRRAASDALAARVVLQRLLPGILSVARRRGRCDWARTLRLYDDLLANAWLVIRCYPIDHRPIHVAANLLRDIEYQTFARPARIRRLPTVEWDWATWNGDDCPEVLQAQPSSSAFAEVVELLRSALDNGLDRDAVRFAAALASGRTLEELAVEHSITPRAERYRRARLITALREIALDPTDDDERGPMSAGEHP